MNNSNTLKRINLKLKRHSLHSLFIPFRTKMCFGALSKYAHMDRHTDANNALYASHTCSYISAYPKSCVDVIEGGYMCHHECLGRTILLEIRFQTIISSYFYDCMSILMDTFIKTHLRTNLILGFYTFQHFCPSSSRQIHCAFIGFNQN